MATFAIPEEHTFKGDWWLPHEPARRISGVLSWKPEHATLELHESFSPLRGAIYADQTQQYPVLHGLTTRSELVTVLRATRMVSPISFGPGGLRETESLVSSWVVFGAHVSLETTYKAVRARIPGLQIWFGAIAGASVKPHATGVTYAFERVQPTPLSIQAISASLDWGIDRTIDGNVQTELTVTALAYLEIKPSQAQTLEWFIEHLGRATTLLSLLAGAPMSPDHLFAKVIDTPPMPQVLVALRDAKYCTYRSDRDFFMLRQDMGTDFGTVFARWYELYDSVAMPSQLATSVLYSEGLWLHVEFLSFMQALEGLHRATMHGLYLSPEQYEPIREVLNASIPGVVTRDHRDALRSRIRYGHEFSLRKRLAALVHKLEAPLRKHILGGDGTVPGSWVDSRNYYTHWDEALRASTLDGPGMHVAGVRMKHLLRALYLDLVGIPQAAILKSTQNARKESQYLIQLNNSEYRRQHPESRAGMLMEIRKAEREPPKPVEARRPSSPTKSTPRRARKVARVRQGPAKKK